MPGMADRQGAFRRRVSWTMHDADCLRPAPVRLKQEMPSRLHCACSHLGQAPSSHRRHRKFRFRPVRHGVSGHSRSGRTTGSRPVWRTCPAGSALSDRPSHGVQRQIGWKYRLAGGRGRSSAKNHRRRFLGSSPICVSTSGTRRPPYVKPSGSRHAGARYRGLSIHHS